MSQKNDDRIFKLTILGEVREYPGGTTFKDIAAEYQDRFDYPIAAASMNGKIRELFKRVTRDGEVEFFTLRDDVGYLTFVRTATMLLLKAICDVFGEEAAANTRVDFTIGDCLFAYPKGKIPTTKESADKIVGRMRELVDAKLPFMKRAYPIDDAMDIFSKDGMEDKVKLFKYRRSSSVNVYEIDGYRDYYYGYMLPNTGYLTCFDVFAYRDGFMLHLPPKSNPTKLQPFEERPKLYETFRGTDEWCAKLGLENVGDLNEWICRGAMNDLILVQEADQEKRISQIAAQIAERGGVKFVMIAGPSSSGKTSFANRLSIQLRTHGLSPHPIGLDDYFVNRENTPRDENGDYNFECIEAIDTDLFNSDMNQLLSGERVELPTYNFKTGHREYNGHFLQLQKDDILVIEGIHGLNPKMSASLPDESKFKVYISALTCINVDQHNRIATTDARMLRRMVRDARTRGNDARRTIQMWPSVRRGEEENIFPFQEEADVMFNSVMIYELAVLKPFAEALLFEIGKEDPEYYEAKRLLKFLDYFLSVPSEFLPNNSICREFVGGSCFRV